MKNAELAKWFASLPPNEEGLVFIVNGDTCSMTGETLSIVTEEIFVHIDEEWVDVSSVGHPMIKQNW